jgi:glycosyltransferase involved in cell wall biosynthesis
VVGDAGLLIDPDEPESLSDALSRVLEDSVLRTSMRKRGIVRSSEFSWAKAAHQTMAVYDSVLETAQA